MFENVAVRSKTGLQGVQDTPLRISRWNHQRSVILGIIPPVLLAETTFLLWIGCQQDNCNFDLRNYSNLLLDAGTPTEVTKRELTSYAKKAELITSQLPYKTLKSVI